VDHDLKDTHLWCQVFGRKSMVTSLVHAATSTAGLAASAAGSSGRRSKPMGCLSVKAFQKDEREKGKKPVDEREKVKKPVDEAWVPEVVEGEAYECSVPKASVDYIETGQEFGKRRRNAYVAYLDKEVKMKGKSEESDRLLKQAKQLLFYHVKISGGMKSNDAEDGMHMVARTKRHRRGKIAEYPKKKIDELARYRARRSN